MRFVAAAAVSLGLLQGVPRAMASPRLDDHRGTSLDHRSGSDKNETNVPEPNGMARADVVFPPDGPALALSVIVSGDGGWHEQESSIARALARNGIAVIGIDSLKYFWARKEPRQVAADLARLVRGYGRTFGTRRYVLIGYSFGADIVPDVWPLLSKRLQDRFAVVALLAPSRFSDFEVTVATMLGVPSTGSRPLTSLLHQLPLGRTLCLYGKEEADRSACTTGPMARAIVLEFAGGHSVGGEVDRVAAAVMKSVQSHE